MTTLIRLLRAAADARLHAQRQLYAAVLSAERGGDDSVQAAYRYQAEAEQAWEQAITALEVWQNATNRAECEGE